MKAVEPGRIDLRLSASLFYGTASHVADCPDLGPECFSGGPKPVPYQHHVGMFMTDLGLDASYGITSWLAAEARLVLAIADVSPTYSELDGTPKSVPNDIHHHDETLVGPRDPWLVLRVGAAKGKLTSTARFGVTIPIGRTEPDPYELARQGQWHEHLQFGTGTFVPIVGGGLSYAVAPVELSASVLALFSVYENSKGFWAPTRFFGSARVTVPFREGSLRPYAEATLVHETEELWHGAPGAEGSNVRTDLLAGLGGSWEFSAPWSVELGVKIRAVRFTDAPSFDSPGTLTLGLATHF